MKNLIIETACLVNGQHVEEGEAITVDPDTAAALVRHGRAKFAVEEQQAARKSRQAAALSAGE